MQITPKPERRAMVDLSNRIARPVSEYDSAQPFHAYNEAGLAARHGFDVYVFHGRALATPTGIRQALELADGAPILAYTNLLHTLRTETYEATAWSYDQELGDLLAGTALLNVEGQPSLRWRGEDPSLDMFNTDPALVSPVGWAAAIEQLTPSGVDGFLLDFLSEAPVVWAGEPPVDLPDGGLEWRTWQVAALVELRGLTPERVRVANGKWPLVEPGFTAGSLVDSLFLERMGAHWYTPAQALTLLAQHNAPRVGPREVGPLGRAVIAGRHLLQPEVGPLTPASWDPFTAARAVAAAGDHIVAERWSKLP